MTTLQVDRTLACEGLACPLPVVRTKKAIDEMKAGEPVHILDVREPAEYAFGHIPGALSIPLGELEAKGKELDPSKEYYVVCRTGATVYGKGKGNNIRILVYR